MIKLGKTRSDPCTISASVVAILLGLATTVSAEPAVERFEVSGHVKYQITHGEADSNSLIAALASETATDHSAELRLNAGAQWDTVDVDTALEYLAIAGDSVPAFQQAPVSPIVTNAFRGDAQELFDLAVQSEADDKFISILRGDRLSIGYTGSSVSTRLGRQAISWGNGLLFQVLDPFNPFAPTAIEREYKRGTDSGYAQWLTSTGDDLQLFIVPRRNSERELASDTSSYALKWRGKAPFETQYDLLASAHYGLPLFGAGLSRSVFEAVVRGDVAIYELENGGAESSFLVNVDRSWEVAGKNFYLLAEYFHSGVGASAENYIAADSDLIDRIERGELYTLGRDYLGAGVRLEWTPLLNIYANGIFNLHDSSEFLQIRFEYDLLQDVRILSGVNLPVGGRGSEFGGVPLVIAEEEQLAAPATTLYLRIAWYF